MFDAENLNSVDIEKKQAILVNTICHCMVDNSMTLEILDNAYKDVQEWYKKNAVVPYCGCNQQLVGEDTKRLTEQ